ncbi:MAG: hypothetical protein JWQ90_4806 [Hydrocarboniphaga sp.]|uniref:DUF2167 domain-containing protein n=1 Tax=Hydrocarboniphaga sp. TaxID=2033016 RepID=UPI0026259C4D|nr:DUF2167 domain-containing protein [Hydrocarboniphaga sp.]MDB5972356.1 hypothetical protein [Hydrocarboniphaga sp.]
MRILRLSLLCGLALCAAPSPAQDSAASVMQSLKPQSGDIELPGGIAQLRLNDAFRYLKPDDTQKLLEQVWGNPPGSGADTLGMIIPAGGDAAADNGWGVIVTYNQDGHVSDKDANQIDYADLLKTMQKAAADQNDERAKQGFPTVQLLGWAEPPHYDASAHKIFWAKDLSFGDQQHRTLNYFVRVLGREGVLELNAVAGIDQLEQVRRDMNKVMGMADFKQGNRYADFNQSTDKLAAYGLAALVAGGVAAKTGLLAKVLAIAFAAKKFLVLILAGVAGMFGKFFKRRNN